MSVLQIESMCCAVEKVRDAINIIGLKDSCCVNDKLLHVGSETLRVSEMMGALTQELSEFLAFCEEKEAEYHAMLAIQLLEF